MNNTSLGLTTRIRQQFTFTANNDILNEVLAEISNEGVSFTAFTITRMRDTNLVRIVVGPPRSNDAESNRVVREVLRSAGVRYQEEEVIQLQGLKTGTTGVLSRIYNSLFHVVKVKAIYLGEENAIIINVSDVQTALRLLEQNNIIR
ncbi:hypothetical protein QFZ87_000183 [Bacillus sp. SLBN-46]|uniref:hypothetical protein n=1 Tax=Bacillus sp. SLBN-46 TaxID=3042283 RepID=UPI00285772D0|nr:hypothetical protein [Bacillus sp. SLBN-46]MDR6120586.1 hypothetical protein [Bacillus sp. SLBN-46]